MQYHLQLFGNNIAAPLQQDVSAVFLVAIVQGSLLVTKNERGWDIPGGHLEAGETPLAALRREVLEETGAVFGEAFPFAKLGTDVGAPVMLFFMAEDFELGAPAPSGDVFGREVIAIEVFLSRYYGDRDLMRAILDSAQQRLRQDTREAASPGNP